MERVLIIEQDAQRMEEIRSALDGEFKLTSCSTQEEAIAKKKQRKRVSTSLSNDRYSGTLLGGVSAGDTSGTVSNLGGVK